jgi:hypothetical protein
MESETRLTELAVGQRWRRTTPDGFVLEGVLERVHGKDGYARVKGRADLLLWCPTTWPEMYTYLGTQDAEPAKGGPGVCVGQRHMEETRDGLANPVGCLSCGGTWNVPGWNWIWCEKCGDTYSEAALRLLAIDWRSGRRDFPRAPSTREKSSKPSAVRTPRPSHREVSGDGRNWINYDHMADPDPFEKYPLRREDGVIIVAAAQTSVRIVGKYFGDAEHDRFVAEYQREYDHDKRPPAVEPTPEQPRQSHCLDAGRGVWSLRSGR